MRTVTLDTNALDEDHAASLEDRLRGADAIYIQDIVLVEKFNNEDWANYAVHELGKLYQYRDLIQCAPGMPYYLQREMETGIPTSNAWAYIEETRSLRQLIGECGRSPSAAKRKLLGINKSAAAELDSRLATVLEGVHNMDGMVQDLRREIARDVLMSCAHDPLKIPGMIAATNFKEMFIGVLSKLPHGPEFDPLKMADTQCAWVRFFYATLAYIVKGHVQPEFAKRKRKRLLNDQNDEDIVVMGSFTHDLIVHDAMAIYVNSAVRACVARFGQNKLDRRSR